MAFEAMSTIDAAGTSEALHAIRTNLEVDEPGLRRRSNIRNAGLRCLRRDVLYYVKENAVGKVIRQVHVCGLYLLLTLVRIANSDFAGFNLDHHVRWLWERRSLLHAVITHETEVAILSEHSGVVNGAVFEAVDQT